MSDYTIAVSWSGKDALADADANKVISGADFNTEFSAARTAINSKADINGKATESFAIDDATIAGLATIGETLAVTGNTTLSTLTVSGIPTIPTAATATNTTQAASTAMVQAAIDADVTVHAALRSSQTVFGHAKIWTSGGDLYIATA
tara:strand:- start:456 stop:899 length:444 start_codon:yes stop_codon:yes gene_type:complete